MAATPPIEVRAGPAFGTLTVPQSIARETFLQLGIGHWTLDLWDDTDVVPQ